MKVNEFISKLQKLAEKNGDVEVALIDMEGEMPPQEIFIYEDKQTGDIGLAGDCWNDAQEWAGHEGEWENCDEWTFFKEDREITPVEE